MSTAKLLLFIWSCDALPRLAICSIGSLYSSFVIALYEVDQSAVVLDVADPTYCRTVVPSYKYLFATDFIELVLISLIR